MARRRKLSKDEQLNRAIARWEAKQEAAVIMLRRSAEELLVLRRKRKRNLARATLARLDPASPTFRKVVEKVMEQAEATVPAAAPAEPEAGNGLPAFLDRTRKLQAMPDPRSKEKKAERRAVEKEKTAAELTGKRRKMPLSGKAALDAIRDKR